MSDYWIKLYHEIIDDPKMATLPDRLWRRSIELFLLAGKLCPDKSGILPNTKQLAWMLRMNTDDLQGDIDQLVGTGIIESIPNGWLVVNFKKRQEPVSSKERKQKQRDRENRNQYYGDDDVTNSSRNVTQSRLTESESESEADSKTESEVVVQRPNIYSIYEQEIGALTPFLAEELGDIEKEYPDGWFEIAVREAKKSSGRVTLKYVMAILKRMKSDGFVSNNSPNPNSKKVKRSIKVDFGGDIEEREV